MNVVLFENYSELLCIWFTVEDYFRFAYALSYIFISRLNIFYVIITSNDPKVMH